MKGMTMPNDSYQPDAPPDWLASADASPEHYRLDLALPAARYRQLLALAGGDAAQALRLAVELLSEAIVDDPAELRQALADTDIELRAAEARIVELARERQELAEALAMMKGA